MLAIVLGFKEKGSTAPFEVIYAGRNATDAGQIADNPPPGIVRTETLKNPVTHHRRHFPDNLAQLAPEPVAEIEEPAARKKH